MQQVLLLLLLGLLVVVYSQDTREDGKCGPGVLAKSGKEARCEHIPPFPTCCQSNGHCGWDCDDVGTVDQLSKSAPATRARPAIAPQSPQALPEFTSTGRYRSDGKCGLLFPLQEGGPAECDPNSEYWCCSEHGFCGGTQEHCYCDTCINFRPVDFVAGGKVRTDRRCGPEFPLSSGKPSQCDGASEKPCCSKHGYCGPGPEHCDAPGSVDYRGGVAKTVALVVGRVRQDRRCGQEFPLEDGGPSECDGGSEKPCCSRWGYCGPGAAHCSCPTCKDYRTEDQKGGDWLGTWRTSDRRCGPDFPLPGDPSPGPTECDPESEDKFCCSKWGYCGGDEEHCGCDDCVNYKDLTFLITPRGNNK